MSLRFKYLLVFLILVAVLVWLVVITYPKPTFRLIACDVGQGDALLAVYGKTQILIDGGPGRRVLDCLSRHIPFWDRTIEVVVLTHPQTDHFGGFIEVFERYNVQLFLATQLDAGSQEYKALKTAVGSNAVSTINPNSSTVIRSGMMSLDIVFPSESYLNEKLTVDSSGDGDKVLGTHTTNDDPNNFSVVANLSFGSFDALLTGDIGPEVINEVLATGEIRDIEYLKVPHHGSKNGLTLELLQRSLPEVAVISSGKNSYGHPHTEILDMLTQNSVEIFRTDTHGDVVIESNGESWIVAD